MSLRVPLCLLLVLAAQSLGGGGMAAPATAPRISISPALPADVPGGAEHADLRTGARFAWQEFIALNWPAQTTLRDTPDTHRHFGEDAPVVWETFRSKVEIYPGNGNASVGPHGADSGAPSYGYDEPPRYVYDPGEIAPCDGGSSLADTAWLNLDEVSQVGFDFMYAGAADPNTHLPLGDQSRLLRFTSKANRTHYEYIVRNKFWYVNKKSDPPSPAQTAEANFVSAVYKNEFPSADQTGGPYVNFPSGSIEAKAAFRRLTSKEQKSGRFYMPRVRYYARNSAGVTCYREEKGAWGLVALHIIQKTPSAPAFTWATFEQSDNLQTSGHEAVEDNDGAALHASAAETEPSLRYHDGLYRAKTAPLVSAQGDYCRDPGARLFYRDVAVDPNTGADYPNTPHGFVCVNRRGQAIPPAVIAINREAHAAIADYEKKHGLSSPWAHYKLVNVQTYPFDKTQIAAPNSAHGKAAYYLSNIVVETDYTLQHNSGGPATRTGGAPSDMSVNYLGLSGQPPPELTYKNTYVLNTDGTLRGRYNMGGCTGCHGLAQVIAGCDYSYLLVGSSVKEPEIPETKLDVLARRYGGKLTGNR